MSQDKHKHKLVLDLGDYRGMGTWLDLDSMSYGSSFQQVENGELSVFSIRPISRAALGNVGIRSVQSNGSHQFSDPALFVTTQRIVIFDGDREIVSIPHKSGYIEGNDYWLKIVTSSDIGGEIPDVYRFVLGKRDGWIMRLARFLSRRRTYIHYVVGDYIHFAEKFTSD